MRGRGDTMNTVQRCGSVVILGLMAWCSSVPGIAAAQAPDPAQRPFNPLTQTAVLAGDAACALQFRCFTGPAALEGNTAVVGTTNSSLAIYERDATGGWTFQQFLVDPDFPPTPLFFIDNGFGSSVGLSGDTL